MKGSTASRSARPRWWSGNCRARVRNASAAGCGWSGPRSPRSLPPSVGSAPRPAAAARPR